MDNKGSRIVRIVFAFNLLMLSVFCLSCQTVDKKTNSNTDDSEIYTEKLADFPPDTIDGVLVKVGTESILLSDLNQAQTLYPQVPEKELLSALIDEKIIEIKARDIGIELTDDELSRNINEFLQSQKLDEAMLLSELEKSGKTLGEYREEFKKEMIKQQLIGRVISPFVNVTTDEVNRFYLQQTKNVKQVEKVKLRSLVLHIPEDYSGDILQYETVQNVRAQIENKADFVGLVRQYSGSQDASSNLGLLPSKAITELPEEVRQKLTDLQINQVVGPIVLGHSVFFFEYLGAEFSAGSDLNTHYDEWKNKLLNIKFSEHLAEYLRKERSSIRIVTRSLNS